MDKEKVEKLPFIEMRVENLSAEEIAMLCRKMEELNE